MRLWRRAVRIVGSVIALAMLPLAAATQSGASGSIAKAAAFDVPAQRFLDRARAGTQRYQSQQNAITDGYNLVGVEFPSMGEHWIHVGRLVQDSIVPERPSILIYINVAGGPVLAGVAYTALLNAGEDFPDFPAPGLWHEHGGTVDDESLPLAHDAMHMLAKDGGGGLRLAVLHAWIWTPNPAGVFATENWSLPFVRLGIPPTADVTREALGALSLAFDDDGYMLLTLRTGLRLTPDEEGVACTVVSAQRERARELVAAVRRDGRLATDQSRSLALLWSDLWTGLARELPKRARELEVLHAALAGK